MIKNLIKCRNFAKINKSNKEVNVPIMEAQLKSSAKQKRNSQSMKGMHIRDQIIQNKTKVGKTQIKIEDKDGVDWFIQKFIDPVKNSSGF